MINNQLMLILLLPITFLYRFLIFIRNALYDIGLFPTKKARCPVVSVGNISVGGTGKTPFVIWLAEQYSSENRNVGILTRGYGRNSKPQKTYIPSDKIMPVRAVNTKSVGGIVTSYIEGIDARAEIAADTTVLLRLV